MKSLSDPDLVRSLTVPENLLPEIIEIISTTISEGTPVYVQFSDEQESSMTLIRVKDSMELADILYQASRLKVTTTSPRPTVPVPTCPFCAKNILSYTHSALPSVTVILEGQERGICFHNHCLTACGKDAITHTAAYGVTFRTINASLTILQAIKQYHRAATGGNEPRIRKWADAQLQAHSKLQKEYTAGLAAWNAQQAAQAKAAEVAEAIRRAVQDMNAEA
jgi:hypothetical protein